MADSVSNTPNETQRPRTILDYALYYANEGLRVLPLHSVRSNASCSCGRTDCGSVGKHPRTQKGVKEASSDPQQIKDWWLRYPDANVGIATGNGLLVIDLDPRHGGTRETLSALVDLPEASIVQTGSGGWHLYLSYDKTLTVPNTAAKLARGIDTRGDGGYVVAPPSMHSCGSRYYWMDRRPGYDVPAPDALLRLLQAKSPPKQAALVEQTKAILEGERRSSLLSLAGSIHNWGASEEVLFLLLQQANQAYCRPPLPEKEVHDLCKSANQWSSPKKGEQTRRSGLDGIKDAATLLAQKMPETQWMVPGLLSEGLSLLAGKPKMGKSWLALGLAVSIARGVPALGTLPTTQGHVLYLGLEDTERRIADRLRRVLQGSPPPEKLAWGGYWSPFNDGGLEDLETYVQIMKDTRFIIIDTLAKVRPVSPTNGSVYGEDYAIITPLKQFAETYQLSILLIHHLRKSGALDPMDEISGSTGLTGATDCNMVLQRTRGQQEAALHITGRDVEEQELTLTFDPDCCTWSLASAVPPLIKIAPDRQAILDLLESMDRPLSPTEIADMLDIEKDKARKKLFLMRKTNQVQLVGRGLYALPNADPSVVQNNLALFPSDEDVE